MSILDPVTCGFVKVGVFEIFTSEHKLKKENNESKKIFKGRLLSQQYDTFHKHYSNFIIIYKTFKENFPKIVANIRSIGKRRPKTKETVLNTFSLKEWENLTETQKEKHSVENCSGCLKSKTYSNVLKQFPVKGNSYKKKAECFHKESKLKVNFLHH